MFCKRNDGVKGHLHTDDKPPVPAGLGTAHRQYPPIEAHIYQRSHGRILITDGADICHTGASLKDLGKKIFAFSKLEIPATAVTDLPKIYYNSIIPLPLCDTRPHEESGFLFSGIGQEPPMIW